MKMKSGLRYGILAVIAAALAIGAYFAATQYIFIAGQDQYGDQYKQALESENPSDPCATPPGYTDEQWQQHMTHHPDRYAECLG